MFQAGNGEEDACPRKPEISEHPSRLDGGRRPRFLDKWIIRQPRPDGVAPLVAGGYPTGNPIRRARETTAAARTNPAPSQSAARRRRSRLSRRCARARRRSSSFIRRSSAGGRGIGIPFLRSIMPGLPARVNRLPNPRGRGGDPPGQTLAARRGRCRGGRRRGLAPRRVTEAWPIGSGAAGDLSDDSSIAPSGKLR
jgi:hypothetical protein